MKPPILYGILCFSPYYSPQIQVLNLSGNVKLYMSIDSKTTYLSLPITIWDILSGAWASDEILLQFGKKGISTRGMSPGNMKIVSIRNAKDTELITVHHDKQIP